MAFCGPRGYRGNHRAALRLCLPLCRPARTAVRKVKILVPLDLAKRFVLDRPHEDKPHELTPNAEREHGIVPSLSRFFRIITGQPGNICLNPEFSTMARVSNVAVLSINRLCHSLPPQTTRINPDGKKLDHTPTSLRKSVGPGRRVPQGGRRRCRETGSFVGSVGQPSH